MKIRLRPLMLYWHTMMRLLKLKTAHNIHGWKYFFAPFSSIRVSNNSSLSWGGKGWLENFSLIDVCNGNLSIGYNVFINRNVSIIIENSITIGNDCLIANNVSIYDHDHGMERNHLPYGKQEHSTSPVVIGSNVWLGCNSVILKGVVIGDNSIIAAGSVVTKSVPPNQLWGGVPAKLIRNI